jgi:7-cyano-7-deazaguanine synthase
MRGVLILSGGVDSTTLLYKMHSDGYEVTALTFNYAQRHKKR